MAYGDFKEFFRKTASNKVLPDKAFNIAKNPKYDRHTSMVFNFFKKNSLGKCAKNKTMPNKQLSEEWHQPIIGKFEKWKVYSSFKNHICVADLADMQLISKFSKDLFYYLADFCSKYTWNSPLKDTKWLQLLMLFKKYQMGLETNQKYAWVKERNVAIDQLNHSCKVMIYKYIQQLMKINLLLLKDFLKPWRKSTSIWFQYQKMCILIH